MTNFQCIPESVEDSINKVKIDFMQYKLINWLIKLSYNRRYVVVINFDVLLLQCIGNKTNDLQFLEAKSV